jgi:hypothetical protein
MVVSGCFEFDPPWFVYNFNPARVAHASKFWVNPCTKKQYTEAIICSVLGRMGIDEIDHPAITKKIFEAVEMAVPLPQLAIDVTIWNMVACVFGSFDYHDDVLYSHVRKSWADFNAAAAATATCSTQMPPSCAVCLEDFGEGGVDDKLITRLPCLHYFHGHCAAPWVKTHPTCPLCREQIMPILGNESGLSKPNPSGVEPCPQA